MSYPMPGLQPPPKKFSALAIVAIVLASVVPIALGVVDWALLPANGTQQSEAATNWSVLIDFLLGLSPITGAILGIIIAATARRRNVGGQLLGVISIAVGFSIAFVAVPVFLVILFFQYATLTGFG